MEQRKGIIMGLASAVGAVAAFFGVRGVVRWFQRRAHEEQRQARVTRRMQSVQQSTGGAIGHQPVDQPDRQPIPATGLAAPDVETLTQPATDIAVLNQSSSLVEYLFNFYEMIELLRIRRKESGGGNGGRSLTPVDRTHFQEVVDRLEEQMPEVNRDDIQTGTLPAQIDRLMTKVRDGLQNLEYTDDDLFRIYGEVRSEACKVMEAMREMGFTENLARVRQMYDCG